MNTTRVKIGKEHYRMEVATESGHDLIADEPEHLGGTNLGSTPDEYLCAALGSCTAATLRMFADRKQWPLEGVEVEVRFTRENTFSETKMTRRILLFGDLTEEQKTRLLDIADKCPVHKTLSHPILIETI
jgi:putative redox protein